ACQDNFEPGTTECRAAVGDCDVAETCDGAGSCPADGFQPIDTLCGDQNDTTCTGPDTCDGDGVCLPNHAANGVSCEDGEYCTVDDECYEGLCDGSARDCGDGLDCTTDTCDDVSDSCAHTLDAGYCLIADICYSDGQENPANQCQECDDADPGDWSNKTNSTSCDDNNACTENDECTDGVCDGSEVNCDDDNVCSEDSCNPATGCTYVWNADLTLNVAAGSECVDTDDTITVTLSVACLPEGINGVQALIHYDTSLMTLVGITAESLWQEIVEQDVGGDILWAACIPGSATATDGIVATLVFDPIAEGATNVTFQADDPPFHTKLTQSGDNITILPDKVDSGVISIDDTVATASNNGPFCEGDTIELSGGPSSGPLGPYTYAWAGPGGFISTDQSPTISDATLAMTGTYYLTITNVNGCEFTADTDVTVELCMVVNVEIEGLIGVGGIYGSTFAWLAGEHVDRDVTFVFTNCGGATDTYVRPVTFTADVGGNKGVGSVQFTGLDADLDWLGIQEGHTLHTLVAVDFTGTLADSVTVFLTSGDFHTAIVSQDNLVDITDFSILASNWETAIGADESIGGDATGDGYHNTGDFALIQPNFLEMGDAADGCRRVGRVSPAALQVGVVSRTPRASISVSELSLTMAHADRADLDGNGVIDARDIRAFAHRHSLRLQPAFEAKLLELEEELIELEPAVDSGFEMAPQHVR
ncbi:MAG: hypothetical protein KAV82_08595, partial [Phycisphaerae bacterium]|nr:hypothetical protein [Phycisphaerae bacterium]